MEDLKNILNESEEYYIEQRKFLTAQISLLPKGAIKKKQLKGNEYYYLQYRKGEKIIQDYIGKTIPKQLKDDLEQRKKLKNELMEVKKALKLLRSENTEKTSFNEVVEKIFRKMTELGLWESGIEIIGAWCFNIYQKYLPIKNYPLRTQDLDILVPYSYDGKKFDFTSYLKELGFEERFNPDSSTYYTAGSMKVEFLAPGKGKKNISPTIRDLNLNPQYLHYVDMLLENTIEIKIAPGIKANLPAPSSFFLHKLLISSLVNRKNKKVKDIKQAIHIGNYILKNKDEKTKLISSWKRLSKSWQDKIKKSLEQSEDIIPGERNTILELKKHLI